MNKLIEEAEELYKQIDKVQVRLINARLNNDEEGKKSAISEMETTMCNASQFLKFLIDRKDNIIDLSEMWNIKRFALNKLNTAGTAEIQACGDMAGGCSGQPTKPRNL